MSTIHVSRSTSGDSTTSMLPMLTWEDIHEPGTYVEVGTGDLYRIPKEALVTGSSPLIKKVSSGSSRFVRLDSDPFIILNTARALAADNNIRPNF